MTTEKGQWSGFVFNVYRFAYTDDPLTEIYKFTADVIREGRNSIAVWNRERGDHTKWHNQMLNAAYQRFDGIGRDAEHSPAMAIVIRTDQNQAIDSDAWQMLDGSRYMLNVQYKLMGRKYYQMAAVDIEADREVVNKRWFAKRQSSTKGEGEHYLYMAGKSTFEDRFRIRSENHDDPYRMLLDRIRIDDFRPFSVAQSSLYATGLLFDAKYRLRATKHGSIYELRGTAGPWKKRLGRK